MADVYSFVLHSYIPCWSFIHPNGFPHPRSSFVRRPYCVRSSFVKPKPSGAPRLSYEGLRLFPLQPTQRGWRGASFDHPSTILRPSFDDPSTILRPSFHSSLIHPILKLRLCYLYRWLVCSLPPAKAAWSCIHHSYILSRRDPFAHHPYLIGD